MSLTLILESKIQGNEFLNNDEFELVKKCLTEEQMHQIYAKRHSTIIKNHTKQQYTQNPQKFIEKSKNYNKINREKYNQYQREYQKKKRIQTQKQDKTDNVNYIPVMEENDQVYDSINLPNNVQKESVENKYEINIEELMNMIDNNE